MIERVIIPIGFTFCVSAVVATWSLVAVMMFLRCGHAEWFVNWLAWRRWGTMGDRRAGALFLIVVILCLSACQPSPVSEAKAEAIRKQSAQDAADQEQARDHREDVHQSREVEGDVLAGVVVFAKQCLILWAAANTMLIITAAAVGLCFAMVGTGQAQAIGAKTRARWIPLDEGTRQYPLIPFEAGGKWRVYNPNTDSVTAVGAIQAPNSQMITAMGAVQLGGAVAQEAAKAAKYAARTDPGGAAVGVASVNPPLVLAGEYQIEERKSG